MLKQLGIGAGLLLLLNSFALVEAKNFSSSSGILLNKHTGVRAEGMGEAQTAVSSDEAAAAGWNPANLFGIKLNEISAAYSNGLTDDHYGALNYALPVNPLLACGANLMYFDAGSFELNTDAGETSTVSAQRDFLVGATGAYHLSSVLPGLVAGANVKYLNSTLLGKYSASALAVDLGAAMELKQVVENLRVGLAIRNLGTPIKYIESADALPSYALAGAAYQWAIDSMFSALVAADAQYDLEKKVRGSLGLEVRIINMIAVRGGYKAGYDLGAFTAGLGFEMENFQVDYAFNPMQALNSVHRVSLKYMFDTLIPPMSPQETPLTETPLAEQTETDAVEPPAEAVYQTHPTDQGTDVPMEQMAAEILEIQRAGGRVSKVILNVGSEQGIKVGFLGSIVDPMGKPLAGLVIRQVDPTLSLAEVMGLGRDIGNDAKAVVNIPLGK